MSDEDITKEINEAIEQSIEENKPEAPADELVESQADSTEGEFKTGITGDMDIGKVAGEENAEDRDRDNEAGEEDKETEEGKETDELAGESKESKNDEVTDETVTTAVSHGIMSVAEARSFGSNLQLQRTIDIVIEQNRLALLEDTNKEVVAKEEEAGLLTLPKLDPEKYDSDIIEILESLKNEVNLGRAEINDLRANRQIENSANKQASDAELGRWFDKRCVELGKDFEGAIGVGDTDSLMQGSTELVTREEIVRLMTIMSDGYAAQGLGVPPINDLFDFATKSVLSEEFKAADEAALKGKLGKRSGQMINRVGRSSGSEKVTPEQETANMLAEKFGV